MSALPATRIAVSDQVGFDYAQLSRAVAQQARETARLIRERSRFVIKAIIDTGRDLIAIKDGLEHGQFSAWLAAECGMNLRSAQNWMNAARHFEGKSETVSYLPARAIYQLAAKSTPEPIRNELIGRLEAGERLTAHEIDARIYHAREEAKLTDEDRKREKKRRERRERELAKSAEKRAQQEQAHKEAARRAVELLVECLGDRKEDFRRLYLASSWHFAGCLEKKFGSQRHLPWQDEEGRLE
jgi:hypothetical protein